MGNEKVYPKLVRDKIPANLEKKGLVVESHIADQEEYMQALKAKLREELSEFLDQPSAEEAGDLLEVLSALCDQLGITFDDIAQARVEKAEKAGVFADRIIIDAVIEK